MDKNIFKLKIVIPSGVMLEKDVDSVTLPSENGEITVLPNHTKYAGLVGTGVVAYSIADEENYVIVSGGVVHFDGSELMILADEALTPEQAENMVKDSIRLEEMEQARVLMFGKSIDSTDWLKGKAILDKLSAVDELISRIGKHNLN